MAQGPKQQQQNEDKNNQPPQPKKTATETMRQCKDQNHHTQNCTQNCWRRLLLAQYWDRQNIETTSKTLESVDIGGWGGHWEGLVDTIASNIELGIIFLKLVRYISTHHCPIGHRLVCGNLLKRNEANGISS